MYVKVRAYPNSKKEEIRTIKDNHFEIRIKEPAERNLANKKICEILNTHFNNPDGGVKIINGHQSPIKLIKIGKD